MRVLVACEESQEECMAFREIGDEAFSADLKGQSGWHPEWHIQGDVARLLNGHCEFETNDGNTHRIDGAWDLIIAHPPCTYLTAAGAIRLYDKNHEIKDLERYALGMEAAKFFRKFLDADCERIAVENPVPMKIYGLPPYTQIIEPYMFGHPWKKRTCLWLKGLPKLEATNIVEPKGLFVGSTSLKRDPKVRRYELNSNRKSELRSKTFPGIARAMAEQWGGKE